MFKTKLTLITAIAMLSTQVTAFELGKPLNSSATITKTNGNALSAPTSKPIVLMNIKLSKKEKHLFFSNFNKKAQRIKNFVSQSNLPTQVELGMNNVPVLDQGMHGTCVTFATTAALDALINRGDYLSQLCSLSLGKTLEKQSYLPSGWDGAENNYLLAQLFSFGVVKKSDQLKDSCGGLKEYPVKESDNTGNEMSFEDYHKISHSLAAILPDANLTWYSLFSFPERMHWQTEEEFATGAEALLNKVKAELARSDAKYSLRLPFATVLPVSFCHAGSCGKRVKQNDTWVLTDSMLKQLASEDGIEIAGHAMVITGYDDNAVAIDNEGKTHKGLLTLRNSWGDDTGDNGNYYMSYDFFKLFILEVEEVELEYFE